MEQQPTNREIKVLIEHWRSLVPLRPLTYGEHLNFGREQAYHLRAFADSNKPAVDVTLLWRQTVIPVLLVPSYVLEENSGLTTDRPDGTLRIYINQNDPHLRQRFTLLHEWKHALDFHHSAILYQQLGSGNTKIQDVQIEAIANDFAAHVLMPTKLVQHVWQETQDILQAAHVFDVSGEAMRLRLEKLGLIAKPEPWRHHFLATPGSKHTDHLPDLACVA
jgi:hypothetical protein